MPSSAQSSVHSRGDSPSPLDLNEEGVHAIIQLAVHELRQPLSIIESLAYYLTLALARSEPSLQPHAERIQEMVHEVDSTLQDVTHALAPSPHHVEAVDLARVIQEAAHDFSKRRPFPIEVHMPAEAICIEGDPGQLDYLLRAACRWITRDPHTQCSVHVSRDAMSGTVRFSFASPAAEDAVSAACPPSASHLELMRIGMRRVATMHGGNLEGFDPHSNSLGGEIRLPIKDRIERQER